MTGRMRGKVRRRSRTVSLIVNSVVTPVVLIILFWIAIREWVVETFWRFRYVEFDGTRATFLRAAATRAPVAYRWFGRTLSVSELERKHSEFPPWQELQLRIRPGDRIWPFLINPFSRAMRKGYVVIRRGKPVGCIVTEFV